LRGRERPGISSVLHGSALSKPESRIDHQSHDKYRND
jgi:hypothetical protein